MSARTSSGSTFRDLNRNGQLDPYEDPTRPIAVRIDDLLSRMTLEEKAGLMFQPIAPLNMDLPGRSSTADLIASQHILHINILGNGTPTDIATWTNGLQAVAESSRLGIPVTISTDPRHAFAANPGTAMSAGSFSQWPEPIGFGAIGDAGVVENFANIARQEYRAVGIHLALHPMADLATEPRWGRIHGTFGEDAELAAKLIAAYIRGFQGDELGPESVACMTKHFPGGGPQKDGEDPHFPYGREQIYPGDNFDHHLIPFEAAFAAGTAQIMPYYGMPIDTDFESVGFAFSKAVITGMLREQYAFDGVICADWGVLNDSHIFGKVLPARSWGVEHLSVPERARRAIEAGIDQFGGESCPEVIVELVRGGLVAEERIDQSVRRLLQDKFRLGLFEQPFVDVDRAKQIVGNESFRKAGELAQRSCITLLKNGNTKHQTRLPLREGTRVFLDGFSSDSIENYDIVVTELIDAEVAIVRLSAPFEPRDQYPLESFFHSGDLSFPESEISRLTRLMEAKPTIVDIFLDRPAVIPEIADGAAVLLGSFGASDKALLDVIFGRHQPGGRLPFELPSSMDAVRNQKPDLPHDSANPLFPIGHGLTF